jgi:hypothetical protein
MFIGMKRFMLETDTCDLDRKKKEHGAHSFSRYGYEAENFIGDNL